MRRISPEGNIIKSGATPKGRAYLTKKSPSGARYTEVQGKRTVAVKMKSKGEKGSKKIFRDRP